MKYGILCFAAIVIIALLAPPADAKRVWPPPLPVIWDELDDDFREVVMRAHTVAIVAVAKTTVRDLGTKPAMEETRVQFKNPVFLCGKEAPKKPTVVGGGSKMAPGTKIIIAWSKQSTELIRYSKANELATRRALAPGWQVDSSLLCPSCKQHDVTADIGKCKACAGETASGMYKLCTNCARTAHQCQACERTVSQASPDVTLSLSSGCRPRSRMGWLQMTPAQLTVLPGQPAKIEKLKPAAILPGQSPKLVVGVWGGTGSWYPQGVYIHGLKNIPAIPELPCVNNDLATCSNLFFLVTGPGIDGVETVGFSARIIPTRADDDTKAKPVSLAKATSTFAELELVPLPDGKAFKTPGTYTVRAVAGRLMSNVHKVNVGPKTNKGVTVPVPLPPGRVHELEGLLPQR